MKVSINNIMNNYTDLRPHTKGGSAPLPSSNDGHSFDAIIIKSNPRQIEEHTFAKSVSQKLSSEVKNTASEERIKNLQDQVAAHTYQIDTYAIASRMLLL
ncbi:MAG: flagellar biosynthesis anti-sigma factor FlgM [Coprococcus sp.]|nr:flagellar biosynthesis anti-sigma factor FlgM [Coprococcus sp.]